MMNNKVWAWGDAGARRMPVVDGFGVEARDGSIGKVDEATYEAGSSYIIVDTGAWVRGEKVLLPAALVERIDTNAEKLYLMLTKDQIKDSPGFGDTSFRHEPYRNTVADHYLSMMRHEEPGGL